MEESKVERKFLLLGREDAITLSVTLLLIGIATVLFLIAKQYWEDVEGTGIVISAEYEGDGVYFVDMWKEDNTEERMVFESSVFPFESGDRVSYDATIEYNRPYNIQYDEDITTINTIQKIE